MTEQERPRTEAGQPLDSFLADAGLSFDDIPVAMTIHRKDVEAARTEGRQQAVDLARWMLMALDWEVFKRVPGLYSSGEMKDIRRKLDRVAGLNASESGQPRPHPMQTTDPWPTRSTMSPDHPGQPPEASDE